jgi:hypothetical protein
VFDQHWVDFLPLKFRNATLDDVYRLFYNKPLQDTFSVANLWHDPIHETLFKQENSFLPDYLGLVGSDSDRLRRKANFLRLSMAAFFVGSFADASFDGGIGPWQSGIFGYYDENQHLVPVEQQPFFVHDTIGLKALNDSNKLILRFYSLYPPHHINPKCKRLLRILFESNNKLRGRI